jgi:hypothetical protein
VEAEALHEKLRGYAAARKQSAVLWDAGGNDREAGNDYGAAAAYALAAELVYQAFIANAPEPESGADAPASTPSLEPPNEAQT